MLYSLSIFFYFILLKLPIKAIFGEKMRHLFFIIHVFSPNLNAQTKCYYGKIIILKTYHTYYLI